MGIKVYVSDNDIVEVPEEVISNVPFSRFLIQPVQDLLGLLPYIFHVSRCTFFRIFMSEDGLLCEIVAGVPPEKHGIGDIRPLNKKRDILRAAASFKTTVKDNLLYDDDVEYFRDMIIANKINAILYSTIHEGDLRGIIIVDAAEDKKLFTEGEIKVFKDIFLNLLHGIREASLQELRHEIENPLVTIGARAKRLARKITDLAKDDPTLKDIQREAEIIESEAKKIGKDIPQTI